MTNMEEKARKFLDASDEERKQIVTGMSDEEKEALVTAASVEEVKRIMSTPCPPLPNFLNKEKLATTEPLPIRRYFPDESPWEEI